MQLTFDPDFDFGVWRGQSPPGTAVAGSAWVGPLGLLGILETELGLTRPAVSHADRVASLVPRLFERDKFFSASARVDPWGTAQRLLGWRDHLWESGWRGEGLDQRRLIELAEVTLDLPPGEAERLEQVAGHLRGRSVDIEAVTLFVDEAALSQAWREVFAALAKGGTRVGRASLTEASSTGNLLAIRSPGARLDPADHGVQLLRTAGPREAARIVAAALAADPGLGDTVFIGADGVLDAALSEFGLPTLGATAAHQASALSELVPMTVGLAWSPMDPGLAHDWLALPDGPIPRLVARKLAATLERWPAVGNPEWLAVLEESRASEDRDAAECVRACALFFSPLSDRQHPVRVRDLIPRVEELERWAMRSAKTSAAHAEVAEQARALRRRFQLADLSRLGPAALDAVLASVTGGGERSRFVPEVGYASVGRAGGLVAPIRRTIWWNFLDEGSQRRGVVPLRESERRALASIGVVERPLADLVRQRALRATRPPQQTTETLLLIAPYRDDTGEPAHPHSLWAEIVGRLHDPRDAQHLLRDAPTLRRPIARKTEAVCSPATAMWQSQTSFPLTPRKVESPSSLSKLLGCSFAYAVEYLGRVRSRATTPPTVDNRLFGQLAHEVFARLASDGAILDPQASERALEVLHQILPDHGAILLMPGHQQELVELRVALASSATALGKFVVHEGLTVHAVEAELTASTGVGELRGTPDLVLADATGALVLIDLKWSGDSYRRDELRSGTALQLAAYGALLEAKGGVVRSVGYLILRTGRILLRGAGSTHAELVHPALLKDTWSGVQRAWAERVSQVGRGQVYAEGVSSPNHEPLEEAALAQGMLSLPPPCMFCSLGVVCGRALG